MKFIKLLQWGFLAILTICFIGCTDDKTTGSDEKTTDLSLTNLTVDPSMVTTREFTACGFYIYNDGPSLLSKEYIQVDYYLSTDSSFNDTIDTKIGDTGFTLSIASEGSYQINLSGTGLDNMVRFWPVDQPAGDYYVFATVTITGPPPNDPDTSNNYVRTGTVINYNP
jgi:hypothetical protein